jgi:hypothetical protein
VGSTPSTHTFYELSTDRSKNQLKAVIPKPKRPRNGDSAKYRRFFRHYRNGKVYDAYDYGHRGWPIGRFGK